MTFAEVVLKFYRDLEITNPLPVGIQVLNPYQDPGSFEICSTFYRKYYNDNLKRFLILGINPGRNGAGVTGIPFTDPIKLETVLGIENSFPKKPELSADFIHSMIAAYGGPDTFFHHFFINSVSPLGFMVEGKNLNYYDSPLLKESLGPFIRKSIEQMVMMNIDRRLAFCLGEGQNYEYLNKLNKQENFFEQIIPLAHPRFIMQYKRKRVSHYLEDYLQKLNSALKPDLV